MFTSRKQSFQVSFLECVEKCKSFTFSVLYLPCKGVKVAPSIRGLSQYTISSILVLCMDTLSTHSVYLKVSVCLRECRYVPVFSIHPQADSKTTSPEFSQGSLSNSFFLIHGMLFSRI